MPFHLGYAKQGRPCTKTNLVGAHRGNVGGLVQMIVVRFHYRLSRNITGCHCPKVFNGNQVGCPRTTQGVVST